MDYREAMFGAKQEIFGRPDLFYFCVHVFYEISTQL